MSDIWRNSSEARASGSYPAGHRFKSHFRHQIWPVGQAVKTRPFHGCNMGSIPVRVTKTNLNRNTFGLGYFSFFIGFSFGAFPVSTFLFLLSAFMPRKTIDKSMECGRLFHAERQGKTPQGLLSWLCYSLQPHSYEALVNCSVE